MEDSLPAELLDEYKQAFQILDRKNIGLISLRDLSTVLCSIGIQLSQLELRLYVAETTGISIENAVTCMIDFKNFLILMAVILTECISGEEVLKIFKEFDKDGDGYISPHELKALLSRYGHQATDDEVKEMMEEADKDGDGMVSLHEFISVMSTSNLMQTRILRNLLPHQHHDSKDDDVNQTSFPDESDDDESCCDDVDDDVAGLVCAKPQHQDGKRKRRKSVVKWLKRSKKLSSAGQKSPETTKKDGLQVNPNSNNNNNIASSESSSTKRRRQSLSQKLSLTVNMVRKQVSKSKIKVLPNDEDSNSG